MEVIMARLHASLIIIILFISSCTQINVDQFSLKISREKVFKEQLLHKIFLLSQNVSDQKAQDTLNEIQERLLLAAPHEYGATVCEPKESDDYILFIPLWKEKLPVGEMWAEVISDNISYAHFLPALQGVTVKTYFAYSETGRILEFLHEAFHANIFADARYDMQSDKTYFEEERDAYTFQGILMLTLGNSDYVKLFENEIARIATSVRESGTIPWPSVYNLESVFGKSQSAQETTFLQKSFWIHAVFTYLDFTSASEKKSIFLAHIAKEGWPL